MAAKSPHLLTLPREIRDKIYSYLHRVVKLPWLMSGDLENMGSRVILEVQVDNLPLHEMLLVNHCLHDEYLESLDLSISFDLKRPNFESPPRSELKRTLETLSRVRHATFYATFDDLDTDRDYWFHLEHFIGHLTEAASDLSTIRIAVRNGLRAFDDKKEIWDRKHDDAELDEPEGVFCSPPDALAGCSLTNHMQCILPESVLYHKLGSGLVDCFFRQVQMCVWKRGGSANESSWPKEDVEKVWPLETGGYRDLQTELTPELEAKIARNGGLGVLRCRDIYGEGLLK